MSTAPDNLTEKEKETLRLIVRGHDAKSSARELGLSVHTINERLRAARRKLDVTSSREAARLLLESEAPFDNSTPENLGYKQLGDAVSLQSPDPSSTETGSRYKALLIGGIVITSLLAITLALAIATPNNGGAMGGDDTDVRASEIQDT